MLVKDAIEILSRYDLNDHVAMRLYTCDEVMERAEQFETTINKGDADHIVDSIQDSIDNSFGMDWGMIDNELSSFMEGD